MEQREYIVTLHKFDDLDSFYNDMETPGGNLYIPNREVTVLHRRPISRNTHYMLTANEANLIKQDPRVLDVELSPEERGVVNVPLWVDTSTWWDKSATATSVHKNWGLLRVADGYARYNWGSNGTTNTPGTVTTTSAGNNVDVVIVDGHMNPDHPEFAVNSDGTGGSRVVQYNWFQHTPAVTGGAAGTYTYTPYVDPSYTDPYGGSRTDDNDHGCHVAGIAAGNSQGWARKANIYNISPYNTNPSKTSFFLDYVRAWHNTKPINPLTGRRNPTVTNHSYGQASKVLISDITSLVYKGISHTGPFTSSDLQSYGVYNSGGYAYMPLRSTATDIDFQELLAAGVIAAGAAGNSFTKIATYDTAIGADYNNRVYVGSSVFYYMRGTHSAGIGMICVGSVGASIGESKAIYSECGPRIDVYAPGTYIISSINAAVGSYVADLRNSSYHQIKASGTSMASPQVTGVLACLAESWPTMKQSQAVDYLHKTATANQMFDTHGGPADFSSLQGSENRFLYYVKERPNTGQAYPKQNLGARPTTGMVYPRPKIYRYGR